MEPNALATMQLSGSSGALDLSLWGLFLTSDIVVKTVIVMLLLASIWCWTIIVAKWRAVRRLNARANDFEETFWSGGSLEDLYDRVSDAPHDPMATLFGAGMKEWRHAMSRSLTTTAQMRTALQQRIERVMQVSHAREMAQLERYMTFLASVGSTAPFIGLFGTVWGIMNAFTSIAESSNTSLAVVAPGIAEALFATALGLFAAIPASAFFNKFANDLGRYSDRLDNFAGEFSAILSRHMEERA